MIISSVGNDGPWFSSINFPSCCVESANVISVGGYDQNQREVHRESSRGPVIGHPPTLYQYKPLLIYDTLEIEGVGLQNQLQHRSGTSITAVLISSRISTIFLDTLEYVRTRIPPFAHSEYNWEYVAFTLLLQNTR